MNIILLGDSPISKTNKWIMNILTELLETTQLFYSLDKCQMLCLKLMSMDVFSHNISSFCGDQEVV